MEYGQGRHMVIGVDFGMTCTGVAFSQAPRWSDPKTFQQWTAAISELANKVPSKIAYRRDTGDMTSWGFHCNYTDQSIDVQELFKLNLDPEYKDTFEYAPTTDQARKWYLDYLVCIYTHVSQHFMYRFPQWDSATVEFVFSVPTTWRSPRMIVDIENLIRAAGFGRAGPLHKVCVSLNEAEAAAIAVARQHLEFNDNLIVCDAGGGTTDVSILKLCSHVGEATKLVPLLPVEGGSYGSALIDIQAQQSLIKRLALISDRLPMSPQKIAERMMDGRFERFKCSFGSEGSDIPTLPLQVPGIPPGSSFPEAGVFDSMMIITREELKNMFDEQVNGIIELIDSQLLKLKQYQEFEQMSFLILSGGLGGSPYLRHRLFSYFEKERGNSHLNARSIRILLAEQPQLAVAHGLVAERIQMITQNVVAIRERRSRLSYGVVCDQLYREEKHHGEQIMLDPRDGQRWAKGQIEWMIRQGDKVPADGIAKEFRAKIQKSQIGNPWKAQVVMSQYPRDQLPRSMAHEGVRTLCVVESNLTGVRMKEMNRHWWNFKKRHSVAEFDLMVIPGSADIKFQLWSDEKIISKDHQGLGVVWSNT